MRNWSIFSDNIRYIQYEQKTPPNLSIDTLDYRQHKELYFKLKGEKKRHWMLILECILTS